MDYVQTIKIDPEGKYVIFINDHDRIMSNEGLAHFRDNLGGFWYNDNEKFIILRIYGDIEVKFEKLD